MGRPPHSEKVREEAAAKTSSAIVRVSRLMPCLWRAEAGFFSLPHLAVRPTVRAVGWLDGLVRIAPWATLPTLVSLTFSS